MAALDQISAITQSAFVPVAADNVMISNPLFVFLARKAVPLDGGSTIRQPVILSKNTTATSYASSDMLTLNYDQEDSAAEFDWAQYAVLVPITGRDDVRNNGVAGIINLVRMKIQVAEASLRQYMGADLYGDGTSNGSKGITGLLAAVDDATNVTTYGNISRSTYTNWKAIYSANNGTGRALTLTLMNSIFGQASKDNARPTLILTTHAVHDKFLGLLQPFQRTMDANLFSLGFPNVAYLGRPVVVDEQIATSPNHYMFMLNTRFFNLYVSRIRNFFFTGFQQLPQQDVAVAKILWMGQLVCSSPRMQAQIRDIDPTL